MRNLLVAFVLFVVTALVFIQHLGTATPIVVTEDEKLGPAGVLIEKTETSHRHVILAGSDYHRGLEYGKLLKHQLDKLEDLMVSKLDHFIGNSFAQTALFSGAMIWFHDAEKFIDQNSLKEMEGVSKSAPKKFNYLADRYTRQIAYHGLHEVGQMFVDEDRVDLGCFASMIQSKDKNWVIGRNFDFDIDGMFDREKVLKWVFPDDGHAYLSVIWSGMVGVVTGVNDQGLFVAINAAGSDDFARVGTPTTIIVKNILTKANSLEEAIQILTESQVFITDIYTLADRKSNRVAIVEKSPKKISVTFPNESKVVANHLVDSIWNDDRINLNRKVNLTSESRFKRGMELLNTLDLEKPVEASVKILRDKTLPHGHASHLGHRGTIDSLIASQSVIYEMGKGIFYVNLGPGTQGKYLGYDLDESFKNHLPKTLGEIPADALSKEEYLRWQDLMSEVTAAKNSLNKNECELVRKSIQKIDDPHFIHYDKERLIGDFAEKCLHDHKMALNHWLTSLSLHSPYAKQRLYLEEKLK